MEAWKIRKVNQWIFRCSGAACPDKREPLVSLFTITYSQILSDHILPAWRYPLMDHGDDVYHVGIVYDTVKDRICERGGVPSELLIPSVLLIL